MRDYKPILLTLLIMLTGLSMCLQAQELSIHVLNVSEGQAVLLHKNQRAMLVDTGHMGQAPQVLQRMQELGITDLDHLLLTHLHPDHASGFFRITEAYPSASIADHCQSIDLTSNPDSSRWVSEALDNSKQRNCVKAGDSINWQDARVSILWPRDKPPANMNLNHYSLVIQVEFREQTLLIMGDADKAAEKAILAQLPQQVDILVVGHHGAKDASSEAFLAKVSPRHSVISVNRNNLRGYPDDNTVKRLKQFSQQVFLTSESGEYKSVFR